MSDSGTLFSHKKYANTQNNYKVLHIALVDHPDSIDGGEANLNRRIDSVKFFVSSLTFRGLKRKLFDF